MPGIRVSQALKKKLPAEQREDIEDRLWAVSGGICHLCGEALNRSADDIEADHVLAESEAGSTDIENLRLAHKACNAAKRNNPTVDVTPYLRLDAFLRTHAGPVRYGECTKFFGITPKAVYITRTPDGTAKFELPDGTIRAVPVFKQTNAEGEFEYCFVELPQAAIFNDEECQPRNIKKAQVWAIYLDLQKNPLHEPPGCRVFEKQGRHRLLMFDGQHKTVATWMCGVNSIVAKVYLNIDLHQTTRLVNSVQAKIKKLPLSPFEVAAKLGDEWEHRWSEYEAEVGTEHASEQGFIDSLKPNDRKRGAQAFQEARLRDILDRDDLSFLKFVKASGAASGEDGLFTEATFKNKILKVMVYGKPLKEAGEAGAAKRTHEADNIVKVLNYFTDSVFDPAPPGKKLTPEQIEIRRRFAYQGALKYSAEMLQKVVRHLCTVDEDDLAFVDAKIDEAKWETITKAIDRLVSHPVWSSDFDSGPKSRAVREALIKNQEVKESLKSVGLDVGYALGVDQIESDWFK
jgi:hypothetical protein